MDDFEKFATLADSIDMIGQLPSYALEAFNCARFSAGKYEWTATETHDWPALFDRLNTDFQFTENNE